MNDNQTEFWKGLIPGPYSVGFQVMNVYDYSRTVIVTEENKSQGKPRPIQISIWYPAEKEDNPEFMSFSEYVLNEGTEFDFDLPDQNQKNEIFKSFKEQIVRWGGKEFNAKKLLEKRTLAIKNADPLTGSYPFILYAPGGDAPSDCNSVLCEYLASHGYVVATCPSNGLYSEEMTLDSKGIETQVRDLEFVLARMKDFPSADLRNVGTVGFSFGGLANVMLANRNSNVQAVVSLDGGVTYPAYIPLMEKTPFAYSRDLRVPFLLAMSQPNDQQTTDFYDKLKYCDAYLLRFELANHFGFSSRYLYFIQTIDDANSRKQIAQMVDGYGVICRYILHFLNGYVKDIKEGVSFIQKSPDAHGFSDLHIHYRSKIAKPAPPTEEDFFAVLQLQGIEKASDFYKKTKVDFPQIQLFCEERIHTTCTRLMNDMKIDEALVLNEIYLQAYRESVNALLGMGNVYLQKHDSKKAEVYFQKVIHVEPDNVYAKEILKQISSGD